MLLYVVLQLYNYVTYMSLSNLIMNILCLKSNEIEKNKGLETFDTLFNQRDYIAAEHYWSPKYIPHSD
jgi:hypothetical protein